MEGPVKASNGGSAVSARKVFFGLSEPICTFDARIDGSSSGSPKDTAFASLPNSAVRAHRPSGGLFGTISCTIHPTMLRRGRSG